MLAEAHTWPIAVLQECSTNRREMRLRTGTDVTRGRDGLTQNTLAICCNRRLGKIQNGNPESASTRPQRAPELAWNGLYKVCRIS
jgi:hypothetical protein